MDERRKNNGVKHNEMVKELTNEQALTINNHENFGWSSFVRRPLFQEPQPVIVSPDKSVVALVDEDGEINTNHEIKLRD